MKTPVFAILGVNRQGKNRANDKNYVLNRMRTSKKLWEIFPSKINEVDRQKQLFLHIGIS